MSRDGWLVLGVMLIVSGVTLLVQLRWYPGRGGRGERG